MFLGRSGIPSVAHVALGVCSALHVDWSDTLVCSTTSRASRLATKTTVSAISASG